jgi:hypothetical protein
MEGLANRGIPSDKSSAIPCETQKLSQLLDVLGRAPVSNFKDF